MASQLAAIPDSVRSVGLGVAHSQPPHLAKNRVLGPGAAPQKNMGPLALHWSARQLLRLPVL
jgi:hypothetical protein